MLIRKQAGKIQEETNNRQDSECEASLIRLCESCSAVLHHVLLIINMHCGATWQKAIAKAISFPKQGLWGVHFKCPPTTTQSELHLEKKSSVIEKKKNISDLPPVKRQKWHGNIENIKCHYIWFPLQCVLNLCKPQLDLSLRWMRSSSLWHRSWGARTRPSQRSLYLLQFHAAHMFSDCCCWYVMKLSLWVSFRGTTRDISSLQTSEWTFEGCRRVNQDLSRDTLSL